MESLIELVAASFARHGIACPDGVSARVRPSGEDSAWHSANPPLQVPKMQASTDLPAPIALPEHNYRKILDGDPAP